MRIRPAPCIPLALLAVGTGDGGPTLTPKYWDIALHEEPARCVELALPSAQLQAHFERRHGLACRLSDEGSHLLVTCGDEKNPQFLHVLAVSEELCAPWVKRPLGPHEQRMVSAFYGCFRQARKRFGIDEAGMYCRCVAPSLAGQKDESLQGLSKTEQRDLFQPIMSRCASEAGLSSD